MIKLSTFTERSTIELKRQSNNFDFLRLLAASFVIISHSSILLLNKPLGFDPIQFIFGMDMGRFGVIIFFIISGFLIAMSWENKKSIFDFAIARFLRIYPAAIVIVLISVFVMGAIITTLPLMEYLTHKTTYLYLQDSTLYRMYYYLPGVFNGNPSGSSINGSLWTLPYEFTCYIFLGIFGIAQILKNRYATLLLLCGLIFTSVLFNTEVNIIVIPILGIDFKTFYPLLLYFISGSVFYKFRNIISFNSLIIILATTIIYLTNSLPFAEYLKILLLPYIILGLGFSGKLHFKTIGKHGDFSYGLYLYAFPVQQLIVFSLGDKIPLLLMVFLSFAFTLPFAIFSWKIIEKPALRIRKKLNLIFSPLS
ncbi:MAG: acyltransferase [Salinivirgaceae bacterium]|jgi:peptidoglycan/LPS O-acetylase OafA/YrhL|nr:acyltransferase [Salinivirgaceae bacterium]